MECPLTRSVERWLIVLPHPSMTSNNSSRGRGSRSNNHNNLSNSHSSSNNNSHNNLRNSNSSSNISKWNAQGTCRFTSMGLES